MRRRLISLVGKVKHAHPDEDVGGDRRADGGSANGRTPQSLFDSAGFYSEIDLEPALSDAS